MVKSTILTLWIIAALSVGTWIDERGVHERVPCPPESAFQGGDDLRLPQGCLTHVQGIWTGVDAWLAAGDALDGLEGHVERVSVENAMLRAQLNELRADLHAAEGRCVSTLLSPKLCAPCPVWSPRLQGFGFGVATCAAWAYASRR